MARTQRTSDRRTVLKISAAAATLPWVHIRTGRAAGKLSIAFWDHWVPKANEPLRAQCMAWGAKNQVEIEIDFITSVGNKLLLTAAAQAKAKKGHDVMTFRDWEIQNHAEVLHPVDNVMKQIIAREGEVNPVSSYLGKYKGSWCAVPTTVGSNYKGPCARISMLKNFAGIDVVKMYPTEPRQTKEADAWTWDEHLRAAEACNKAGFPFGIGLGTTVDSTDTMGALFHAFGAAVVNAKGDVTLDTDEMKQALEHAGRLAKVLPHDTVSYDDASNNRALIAGRAALIWNPPSAWAVAKRDAPAVAEDCWSFPAPRGPKGRFTPAGPWFWGVWSFSPNKSAGAELLGHLMQRSLSEERVIASQGFDVPPYRNMLDFPIWGEIGPPPGTLYSYPARTFHDGIAAIAGAPAPPEIGVQIYSRGLLPSMVAKLRQEQTQKQVIDWAKHEVEGFR
jgi:ABC-type glycerol-3-phosphate transport system substrate-binding protein